MSKVKDKKKRHKFHSHRSKKKKKRGKLINLGNKNLLTSPILSPRKKTSQGLIFGCPLSEVEGCLLPNFVYQAMDFIIDYVTFGDNIDITDLFKKDFRRGKTLNKNKYRLENKICTVHDLTALQNVTILIHFFEQLPEPLLKLPKNTNNFLKLNKINDHSIREEMGVDLIHQLPPLNKRVLSFMVDSIRKIVKETRDPESSITHICNCFGQRFLRGREFVIDDEGAVLDPEAEILVFYVENFHIFRNSFEDITYTEINGKQLISTGTVAKLIEKLVDEYYQDNTYKTIFFQTHQYFIPDPAELLRYMLDMFKETLGDDETWKLRRRLSILFTITLWIRLRKDDLQGNVKMIDILNEFENDTELSRPEIGALASMYPLLEAVKSQQVNEIVTNEGTITEADISVLEESLFRNDLMEFADQLCLYEYNLFKSIPSSELMHGNFNSGIHFQRFVNHCNDFYNWIQRKVLEGENPTARADIIEVLVKIAQESIKKNNYNSAWNIYVALNSMCISRLTHTWKEFKKRDSIDIYEDAKELFSVEHNCFNYQEMLKSIPKTDPLVPCCEMITKELTMIEDGNPAITEEGHVNFEKMRLIHNTVQKVSEYQQGEYQGLTKDPHIFIFFELLSDHSVNEDDLYELSLQREPREQCK
eukprot:TRINITY_DN8459_c0_g1_i1.p1 TRINITY_DN8459_c0_g1~~TRINITY_DN8459_c0_g1_i1.p1  ORF type:complete len:661 (-),score=120.41 TRINITY_DN8459_c0_g1_i1:17-1957(-)